MTDAPALDAVIDELKRRIDRYAGHGESAAVLDEAGNALLAQARELAARGELTSWTALVLARFHWCRDRDPRAVMTWAAYLHSGP